MLEFHTNTNLIANADLHISEKDFRLHQLYSMMSLFNSSIRRAQAQRIKSVILRRANDLVSLNEIRGSLHIRGSFYAGIKTVEIDHIIGSEGRPHDYDRQFNPRRWTDRNRWVAVAVAHLNGGPLPPVELIQIGDVYFVRDGHHRISVAHAMGQVEIEAEVIGLDAAEPLPEVLCPVCTGAGIQNCAKNPAA